MIKNIVKNIENNDLIIEDIKYIWNLDNSLEISLLDNLVAEKSNNDEMNLESNIYYPLIYQIEDNCPTCGYRTSFSKQKYSEEFIQSNIEFKLKNLDKYPITGINCYNKDITGLRELFIILNLLKIYDLEINVAVSNYDYLKYLKNFDIHSIIFIPEEFEQNKFNYNNLKNKAHLEEKVIKFIKENMNLKATYQLTLNYNETHHDMLNIINKMKNLNVDIIELRGFDPFIDSPEEYNPQYSKEYILRIIRLLKLYLPHVELKIQYATNNCNYISNFKNLGVNSLTGIYTQYMNSKLENIRTATELLKK